MKKYLKIILNIFYVSSVSSLTYAQFDIQKGAVGMNGEILESACSIDINSLYQTIDMGNIPVSSILNNQDNSGVEFEIKLVDCRWGSETQNKLTSIDISFTGNNDKNHFLVEGDAEGIYLGLESLTGHKIFPGEVLMLENDFSHEHRSKYKLKLLPNGEQIKTGSFDTLIQFNISYK